MTLYNMYYLCTSKKIDVIFDISIHSNESNLFIFKQNLMILFCIASFGSVRFYVYIYEMVFRVCVC